MPVRHRRRAPFLLVERGQTMAEFAVVLPVLALLLFGVIQFGSLFNNYLTVTDATRAGARKASVARYFDDPVGETEGQVRRSAADLDQDELEVDVSVSPGWQKGAEATVSATYPYEINLLGFVFASGDLSSETSERVE